MEEVGQIYAIKSAYIIILMMIMAGFTGIRYGYANIFRNTYGFLALFSFKPMAEQRAGIKLLSTENLLITLLLAASLAFSLMLFAQFFSIDIGVINFGEPLSLSSTILVWLTMIFAISLLFVLKFAFVGVVGWLFDFPSSQSAHFEEYQSMSHVFNFFFTLILGLGVIAMGRVNDGFMLFMGYSYVIFFIIREFILIFRLYVKGSFSIYYIFSYICTTELIPWIICLGLVLNS